MKKIQKLLLISILATVLVAVGCHREAPQLEKPESLPSASVNVVTVGVSTNPATASVVGTVRARSSSMISAKISGRLTAMKTKIGERVNAGDLIAEIDAGEIAARMDQAEAALENATRDLERFQKLLEQSAVTRSEYEAVETRHRIAQATANEARSMMAYTRIQAPFDAVIVRARADVGDLASPGMPLLEIDSIGGLRFESNVSESLVRGIQIGDPLTVSVEGVNEPMTVMVSEVAPTSDALSRTRTIRLDLPEMSGLRAGQFGRVDIPVAPAANVMVPIGSIVRRGQMEMVFVENKSLAVMRLVKTGKTGDGLIEVLSGVEAGDRVVASGANSLRDGQPLLIQE